MTILSNGHQWRYSEFTDNTNYSFDKNQILKSLSSKEIDEAYNSISKWKGYAPTPLVSLSKLSKELKLKNIFYKDEHRRFDLKSFKALVGANDVERISKGNSFITLASYKTKEDYWMFKQWTVLGTTILREDEWIEVLNHTNYTGDYYFTNAETLSLKKK